jgi:enoyl-CoA hydratase/carnithine racemase
MTTQVKVAKAGGVATLTFESQNGMHILSRATMETLREALDGLSRDVELQALVITGAGSRCFSAGADLRELAELDLERAVAYSDFGQDVARMIARYSVPTFAALNGAAYGGGIELALACDFRIAMPETVIHYQAARLGLLPGWGGTQRLPDLLGRSRAKAMMLMCRPLSADEALDWGLVDDVCHGTDLAACVRGWTDTLVAMDRTSAIQIKRAIDLGAIGDFAGEREAFAACFASGRTQERIRAWLARSKGGDAAETTPDAAAGGSIHVPGLSGTV